MDDSSIIDTWRRLIMGDSKAWVIFQHGTCVVLPSSVTDPAVSACEIMRAWGPVHVASPAGDFGVITLDDASGWVVTCHHPDVLNYVSSGELGDDPSEVAIGMLGRSKRDSDAGALTVLHVERRDG